MKTCAQCHSPTPEEILRCPVCQSATFVMAPGLSATDGKPRNHWLTASRITYVLCVLVPAYTTDYYGTVQWHWGLEAFLLGPIGFFAGHFSWAANPLIWFAWKKMKKSNYTAAISGSVIALALASTFLLQKTIAVGSAGEFPYAAHLGYYLWLLSMLLVVVSGYSSARKGGS